MAKKVYPFYDKEQTPVLYRAATLEGINEDERTVSLAFSSDTPIERFYGYEILDHSPGAVVMDRLDDASAALLLEHDRKLQIGVIVSAVIDSDGKGRASAKFSRSKLGEDIYQDVIDGIRKLVSVGYEIIEWEELEETKNGMPVFLIKKWRPLEISFVSIPADVSVGVGRKKEDDKKERSFVMENENKDKAPAVDAAQIREKELKRYREITAYGEQFDMAKEAQEAYGRGDSLEDFKDVVLSRLKTEKKIDVKKPLLDMSDKEKKRYSLSNIFAAGITGNRDLAGFEYEVSAELAKILKRDNVEGILVPHQIIPGMQMPVDAARDLLTSSAADLVPTEHAAGSFIELLRNKILLNRLGVLTLTGLSGNVDIPKQTGAATAQWLAEGSSPTGSDSAFGDLNLTPKTLAADTPYSKQLLLQGNPSIEQLVMNDLARVIALALDLGGIAGTGASNQPTGILNTSGIGDVAVGAGNMSRTHALEFETDVAAANGEAESMAFACGAVVRGYLKGIDQATGAASWLCDNDNRMIGYPVEMSNQVPANTLIFGDFAQAIIAIWGALELMVDPYSASDARKVVLRATQFCDIGVRHAAAFSAADDVQVV